jgi:hypothetical protein
MPRENVSSRQSAASIQRAEKRSRRTGKSTGDAFLWRRLMRVLLLALLLAIIAGPTLLPKFSVVDNDIWWHLKTGDWILAHHAFPHTGILTRTAADRPWMAYSWLYEVLLSGFHSWFELAGISIYGLLLALAVAYGVFWMADRLSGRFWVACLLTLLGCAAFLFNMYPRPAFFSMLLFTITLTLLLESRRTGRIQVLYWLPPLFFLWANLHIQFVYGLLVVGLLIAVNLLEDWAARAGFGVDSAPPPSLPPSRLLLVLACCLLATCVGPYSFHLYSTAFQYAESKFPYALISEFQALRFRRYTDYVQLLLTASAFFVLGRKKTLDLFLLALMVVASMVGFRTARDAWFVCIPAMACLAEALRSAEPEPQETIAEKLGLAVAVGVLLLLYARAMNFNTQDLRLSIASQYPVHAINYLRQHPQPGPLYNTFGWGGFIAWYMPELPVAIDGRTDLYGDELDYRFYQTENGDPSWVDDPYLNEAQLVLLPRETRLASLLNADSRFNLIYQDELAMVFVKK